MTAEHRSEWQKMVAGELYRAQDPELVALRANARRILRLYNASVESGGEREALLEELLGARAEGLWIEPPFYCDYGRNIAVGRNVYFNFGCIILDVAPVTIGDDVMFGPAVQIYTATHPLGAAERRSGLEYGRPIRIGSDVWVGGATVINPGVTIGAATVIGSGSVVTRDLPEGVFAAGNPCRVIREIGPEERSPRAV
jgi:maltose O-acetyltransferase